MTETELQEIERFWSGKTVATGMVEMAHQHVRALLSTVRELQRQVAELKADAKRYRLIRPASFTRPLNVVDDELNLLNDEELDAAIDAALNTEDR